MRAEGNIHGNLGLIGTIAIFAFPVSHLLDEVVELLMEGVYEVGDHVYCDYTCDAPAHIQAHLLICQEVCVHRYQVSHREYRSFIENLESETVKGGLGLHDDQIVEHEETLHDKEKALEDRRKSAKDHCGCESKSSKHVDCQKEQCLFRLHIDIRVEGSVALTRRSVLHDLRLKSVDKVVKEEWEHCYVSGEKASKNLVNERLIVVLITLEFYCYSLEGDKG